MKARVMKKPPLHRLAAAAVLGLASLTSQAAAVVVDVSGAQSVNLLGETGNTVWLIDIGANALLNSVSWNLTLNALDPSLLSEMQLSFGSASGLDLVTVTPAGFDPFSGTGSYVSGADLSALGLVVGSDGLLRIEFSEGFKDFAPGTPEGQWVSGTLSFDVSAAAVPEPASAALVLLGLGLVGAQHRRAKRGASSVS